MREIDVSPQVLLETVREAVASGRSITIAGTGASMAPFIDEQRDKVTLSPLPERLLPGHIVLYSRPNGQAVIHRVYRVRGDLLDMLGEGQFWVERGVPRERAIAYATSIIRPSGEYKCAAPLRRKTAVLKMRLRLLRCFAMEFIKRTASRLGLHR